MDITGSGNFLLTNDPTLLACPRFPKEEDIKSDNLICVDEDPNVFFNKENDTLVEGTAVSVGLLTNIL